MHRLRVSMSSSEMDNSSNFRGVAIVFVADINVDPEAFAVSGRARILYAHLHTLKRC